jgi:hypothetical protein
VLRAVCVLHSLRRTQLGTQGHGGGFTMRKSAGKPGDSSGGPRGSKVGGPRVPPDERQARDGAIQRVVDQPRGCMAGGARHGGDCNPAGCVKQKIESSCVPFFSPSEFLRFQFDRQSLWRRYAKNNLDGVLPSLSCQLIDIAIAPDILFRNYSLLEVACAPNPNSEVCSSGDLQCRAL